MTDGTGTKKKKKRLMPVRIERLEMDGDYEGWWFTARVNPRMEMFNLLMQGTYAGMVTVLSELLVGEWNFVDEEGEPLSQPHLTRENYETWEALTDEEKEKKMPPLSPHALIGQLTIDLVMQMAQVVGEKVQDVPGN